MTRTTRTASARRCCRRGECWGASFSQFALSSCVVRRISKFGASVPSPRPSRWLAHSALSTHPSHPATISDNSEQLELLEEKLRELAALPRGDSRSDDDRAVALSQVDALRKELALVCRAGLPSVVFGKVNFLAEGEREGEETASKREAIASQCENGGRS